MGQQHTFSENTGVFSLVRPPYLILSYIVFLLMICSNKKPFHFPRVTFIDFVLQEFCSNWFNRFVRIQGNCHFE